MTTPKQRGEFYAGGIRLLRSNDLQSSIDKLKTTVDTFNSAVGTLSQDLGNGMTSRPIAASQAGGQRSTSGSFPSMRSWADQAVLVGQKPAAGAASPASGSTGNGSFGGRASGSGANAGGATFSSPGTNGGGTPGSAPGGSTGGSGGSRTTSSSATGMGTWGGGTWSGGSGGGSGNAGQGRGSGSGSGNGGGFSFAKAAGGAVTSATGTAVSSGLSQLSNQELYNAYGQQTQAQWGQSAQSAQNAAFGSYNSNVNNAAAGNAQDAAGEMSTINSMTGGGAISQGAILGTTNALAFSNQGMSAGNAANLASTLYNPTNSMRAMMLSGVSSINAKTGQDNSLTEVERLRSGGGSVTPGEPA